MTNRIEFDSPELYDHEEICELIRERGIDGALAKIDTSKVPDAKLRNWLEQAEKLHERIKDRVFPSRYLVKNGKTRKT